MLPHSLSVVRSTLSNGLAVVCVPQPSLHSACMALHVRVGSRFETPDNNGCSHALEHMLFRGTRSYANAHEQALALERLGGTLYAATHTEHGVLSLVLPPENLEQAFSIFAEVITSPRFTDLEIERGIIREEILESLDEDGRSVDPDNLSRALMYGEHGLGLPIAGTLELLEELGLEQLQRHHQRHYTAQNAVLSFAGDIDPERCLAEAQKHLALLVPGDRQPVSAAPWGQKTPRFQYVETPSSQTDLRLSFRAPGLLDPTEPAAEVLLRLLDDGMSTRLYARICDEKGLCYDVSADYETFEDDGVLDLAATVQHARAPVVLRELCALVQDIARHGPSDDELNKCKARHRWEIRALLDNADALADYHGLKTLSGSVTTLAEREAQIAQVGREQVIDIARQVFRPERLSAVAVGVLQSSERRALEQAVHHFGRAR